MILRVKMPGHAATLVIKDDTICVDHSHKVALGQLAR